MVASCHQCLILLVINTVLVVTLEMPEWLRFCVKPSKMLYLYLHMHICRMTNYELVR